MSKASTVTIASGLIFTTAKYASLAACSPEATNPVSTVADTMTAVTSAASLATAMIPTKTEAGKQKKKLALALSIAAFAAAHANSAVQGSASSMRSTLDGIVLMLFILSVLKAVIGECKNANVDSLQLNSSYPQPSFKQ